MPVPPMFLFLVGASALLAGCASRPLHPTFSGSSAASLEAGTAPSGEVTTALDAEPPLPGESTERWPGLEPAPGDARTGGHRHAH